MAVQFRPVETIPLEGLIYPWGNAITHDRANYRDDGDYLSAYMSAHYPNQRRNHGTWCG